jgi:hypothetical protein
LLDIRIIRSKRKRWAGDVDAGGRSAYSFGRKLKENEHSNEPRGCMKCSEFFEWLSHLNNWWLLKDSAPWS